MSRSLLAIFLLIMPFSFIAQDKTIFRAGITAGPVISDIDGADFNDYSNSFYKVGVMAGGLVNTRLNNSNVLQLEINYIQKGTRQNPDSANNGYYKLSLDYVEVPLVLKHRFTFNVNKKKLDVLDIEFGASYGRMISLHQEINNYPMDVNKMAVNRNDVSLLLGFNYNLSEHFYIGIRYTNSLIPVINRNDLPLWLIDYTFNRGNNLVFQFSLRYVFGNDRKIVSATELPPANNEKQSDTKQE